MAKRLSRADAERLRKEVAESLQRSSEPIPDEPTVRKLLACGHEGEIHPGADPQRAWCDICIARAKAFQP